MTSFSNPSGPWDLSLPPTLPALADDEFIALLQKQFGVTTDPTKDNANNVAIVNPQSLTRFPIPAAITPPSEDSSPSPPENPGTSRSRRQSGQLSREHTRSASREQDDDPALKRKASDEDLDDEPSHKSQHTSGRKGTSSSRRKSTGNPSVDESRLLKRKEQNRAAQRAFRERKEKHVKDLEDKVAALEERNNSTLSENEALREVITRLQNENIRLREASFTFSVPSTSAGSSSSRSRTTGPPGASPAVDHPPQDTPMSLFGSPPSATSSATASTHDSPQSLFANEKNGGGGGGNNDFTNVNGVNAPVSFFDRQSSEHTATADAMGLDFGFGPVFSHTPYTTIASNPMFMSFREPESASFPMDATPMGGAVPNSNPAFGANGNNSNNNGGGMAFGWPDVNMSMLDNLQAFDLTNSLDELFGGATMNTNGPMDYQQYKNNFSASQSPVSHQNGKSSTSTSTNSSSPNVPQLQQQQQQQLQSPNGQSIHQSNANANHHDSSNPCANGSCPSTKESFAAIIAKDEGSMFVAKPSPPVSSPSPSLSCGTPTSTSNPTTSESPANTSGGSGSFVPCSNLQLPKTVKSDQNVEVMSAWKIIQANPKFQDVDINELCAEFASKARCDGSQVVIEPDGMKQILEAVSRKVGVVGGGGVGGGVGGGGANGVGVGVGQQ